MNARERILDRLRASAPDVRGLAPPEIPRDDAEAPLPSLRERMTAGLVAAHAEVRSVSRFELAAAIAEFCVSRGLKTLMLPPGDLPFDVSALAGVDIERFDRPIEGLKKQLFSGIDAGLTLADCAIADTGTLVMGSSPRQPRTLSLVPPIHLCLIDERRIHPNLGTAMRAEGWANGLPTNLIFVSGPSKTADIQQTLAYGAHGPKELVVFVFEGGKA